MHRATLNKKLNELESQVAILADTEKTVIGIVSVCGKLLRSIKQVGGKYVEVEDDPKVYIPEKLEPIFTRPKRFMILEGGRGSGKSITAGDYVLADMNDNGNSWMCLREFQSSIGDSVHGLLKDELTRLQYQNFNITDKTIASAAGGRARFNGIARNPESVKSAFGFDGFWVEEAQFLSQESIDVLTPTARKKPKNGLPDNLEEVEVDEVDLSKVRMLFTANPAGSQDPFSQRFLVPFQSHLDRDGIYEDDLHLIIKMNYIDNPWFKQSGLEEERQFAINHTSRAVYEWIWNGGYNDSVDNAIISVEMFQACIDAHEKLGFKPSGVEVVSHDPADSGDAKAVAHRYGSVFLDVFELDEEDVNDACEAATNYAINNKVDKFVWDGGGLGLSLKRQINNDLAGKTIEAVMFSGAEGVDNPSLIYDCADKITVKGQKQNHDVFFNKRAQYYWILRDRVYKTFRAVTYGEYCDPDEMISFSSKIKNMSKLQAEICKIPRKKTNSNNDKIQIMSKEDMKKLKIPSPNMADCVMMSLSLTSKSKPKRAINRPPVRSRAR